MPSAFFIALLCVVVGNFFYEFLCRKHGGLTNFHRYLFSTGFAYIVRLIIELVKFFIDYFTPGSALQGYNQPVRSSMLLYRLLGPGKGEEHQWPLYTIDYNILYTMVGAAVGAFVLLLVYEWISHKRGDENGIFYGYHFPKQSPKAYLKSEFRVLRKSIPVWEYITWWIVRICLVGALIRRYKMEGGWDVRCLVFTANLIATFIIPMLRVLFFAKLYFGNIPYRTQSIINIIIFLGAFLFHTFDIDIPEYDKWMHVLSGSLGVLIGYQLILATRRGKDLPAVVKALAASGFSTLVMLLWEIFEFLADHFIFDSHNQNQLWNPDDTIIFFRIFGKGVENPGAIAVLDTNIDLVAALVSCTVSALGLILFLKLSEAHRKKKEAAEPAAEPETVSA